MSLILGHKLAVGFCQGFKCRPPTAIATASPVQACLRAMNKRSLPDAGTAPSAALNTISNNRPNIASTMSITSSSMPASPALAPAPPSKRRRLQHQQQHHQQHSRGIAVAASPLASQTVVVAPKAGAAAASKPKSKPQPAKAPEDGLWLIVGLGNPGANYDGTRHNVGFMVVDELARQEGIDCRKLEKSAAVGKGAVQGKQVLLVKPVTFMNNSGESVAALAKFYGVPSGRVLVVADDLDQPVAQVRLRQRGGHGGHNGLRSIMDRMGGTHDFPRIKIGIGRPTGPLPIATYVLQPFSRAERPDIEAAVQESVRMLRSVLGLGLDKAASGQRI